MLAYICNIEAQFGNSAMSRVKLRNVVKAATAGLCEEADSRLILGFVDGIKMKFYRYSEGNQPSC